MLDRGPGDRQAVEGRGAAADFVEDDQRAFAGLVEDDGGLDHLDHEGGAAAREIVGRADAREQPVDDADPRPRRRHVGADLRHQRDQRVLPQEGRFARHVGAGDQPDLAGFLRGPRREVAGIGDERLAVALQRLFDHGMPAALDGKAERAIDLGPHVIVVDRELCQRGRDIEQRKRMRGGAQIVAGGERHGAEPLENFQLEPERAVAGIGDLGLDLAEFGGGEANLSGQRLAMDEGRVQRRRHQLVAVLRGHLDEIAEHVVVADFERP